MYRPPPFVGTAAYFVDSVAVPSVQEPAVRVRDEDPGLRTAAALETVVAEAGATALNEAIGTIAMDAASSVAIARFFFVWVFLCFGFVCVIPGVSAIERRRATAMATCAADCRPHLVGPVG